MQESRNRLVLLYLSRSRDHRHGRERNGPFFGSDALRRVRVEPSLRARLTFRPVQSAGGVGFDAVFSIAAICNAESVTLLSSSNQMTIRLLAGFTPVCSGSTLRTVFHSLSL